MFKFVRNPIRNLRTAFVLFTCLATLGGAQAVAEVVVLRSGNAPIGSPDPQINVLSGSGGVPLSASPFTPADFQAACAGRSAMVINPHPAWAQIIPCDPLARWVGTDAVGTPASALYCHTFDVQTCCIQSAIMNFCWSADDVLGDLLYGGPNPDGVYINGIAVAPGITNGNYATETLSGPVDVTALLQCGSNQLQIYNRDAAFAISGVIYSVTIDISDCTVPQEPTSFGDIKALYR